MGIVKKKQKQCTTLEKRQGEVGDQYIYVAMDSETKLVISYKLGKRDLDNTIEFMRDLSHRVTNRFQLSTDSFGAYSFAVDLILGNKVDYAQLHKIYAESYEGEKRYSPARIIRVETKPVLGNPEPTRIRPHTLRDKI